MNNENHRPVAPDFDARFERDYPQGQGQWYVMRATYGRAEKARQLLATRLAGDYPCKSYVPFFKTRKEVNGHMRTVRRPYLGNLLYVYATADVARRIAGDAGLLSFVSFYYDHFSAVPATPLVIPRAEMKNFMRAMHARSDDKHLVPAELVHYRSGDLVEVLDGPFRKVQGRIARVMGQQRVVVDIGTCILVTSYIAAPLLKIVEEGKYPAP